jgi:choline kinase
MRAVILAAGDGGRLGAHTTSVPKPLVPLNGRPIVAYTLEALRTVGVLDAVVVTGYRGPQVVAGLSALTPVGVRLAFASNPRFHGGASLSLRAARMATNGEPFLLLMSDHVVSAELLDRLLTEGIAGGASGCSSVAADFSLRDAEYVAEATKLVIDDEGFVTAIGKDIAGWSALDAGAFYVSQGIWEALESVPEDCELSAVFGHLAATRRLRAADIDGAFWYDIDTVEDLEAAASLLAGGGRRETPVPGV